MDDPGADAAARRSLLLGAKLRGLTGRPDLESAEYPAGVAAVVGDTAWVLVEGPADRALGQALAWAIRQGAASLDLIAESALGTLARRAASFTFPIRVWTPSEHELVPAEPAPLPTRVEPAASHLALQPLIAEAGAEPNVEHGVVFGEVRGLEVCRVVDSPTVGSFAELSDVVPPAGLGEPIERAHEGVMLEVGVGAADREAFQLLHGDVPTAEALRSVVESVARHRRAQAPQHPLNRLARERFLRWRLEQEPGLVGMVEVVPAEPPSPRPNLKDAVPCVATGRDADGREISIVCSTGVDLDLVPFANDVRSQYGRDVVIALPGRDVVKLTVELAGLVEPALPLVRVD